MGRGVSGSGLRGSASGSTGVRGRGQTDGRVSPDQAVDSSPAPMKFDRTNEGFTDRLMEGKVKIKSIGGPATLAWAPGSKEATTKVFKKEMTGRELADAIGAPTGSSIRIVPSSNGRSINFEVKHPDIEKYNGEIARRGNGDLTIGIGSLYMKSSEALGTRIGLGIVGNAQKHGIRRMSTFGAGSSATRAAELARGEKPTTGFSTWANLGGKAKIPQSIKAVLRSRYGMKANDTNQLMIKYGKAGMDAWKQVGSGAVFEWDLRSRSPQLNIMKQQLDRLGRKIEDK